jgi:hypothetical protein
MCILSNGKLKMKPQLAPARKTIVKASKYHKTSQSEPRRGRPPKADQERILVKDSWVIAQELRLHPLRPPIDRQFAPYYERVLKGELRAIYDYCDRNAPQLGASFYELLGFLVTIRFYRVANQILLGIERRGSMMGWPSDRDTYDYWYKEIKPVCERARQFIRTVRKSGRNGKREQLWREYVLQPLPTVRYLSLAGKAEQQLLLHSLHAPIDEQFRPFLERILSGDPTAKTDYEKKLQKEQNDRDKELRRSAGEELLEWSNSHTKSSVRSRMEALGCHGRELDLLAESRFHLDRVNKFRPFGLVTREIFFELAKTKPLLTPAVVARRCACKIVRFSESWASHKHVREL